MIWGDERCWFGAENDTSSKTKMLGYEWVICVDIGNGRNASYIQTDAAVQIKINSQSHFQSAL